MSKLTLKLLGSFRIELDHQPLEGLGTTKSRALLVYLALERAKRYSRDQLATLFWPSQSEKLAKQSLRQALFQLKKEFGGREVLSISNQTVQVDEDLEIESDAARIEKLASVCQDHQHRGLDHCLPCLRRQQDILALYHGEFLAGFPLLGSQLFNEWLILRREKLHLIVMAANVLLGDYCERRGEYSRSLNFVQQQLAMEPWREASHRQAMCLYAFLGERSRALLQYQECEAVLQKEFGVAPTAETRKLVGDIKADWLTRAPLPQKNYAHQGLFVGRQRELHSLVDLVCAGENRLLTILGPGGVGKSALAGVLIAELTGLFKDGTIRIQLEGSEDLLTAIADGLGLKNRANQQTVLDYLRERDLLLLLDNFDHPNLSRAFIGQLIANCENLQILVTSREMLNLRGEKIIHLKGLAYPEGADGQDWQSFDALVLLEKLIRGIHPEYPLTETNLQGMKDLAEKVDGLPLALEFLANLIAKGDEIALKNILTDSLDSLQAAFADLPDKHQSMALVFEQSWQGLDILEQEALSKLSIFIGGFSLEAAAEVVDVQTGMIAALVKKSLVVPEERGRYRIHATFRHFIQQKWEPEHEVMRRHAAYYASLPQYSLNTPSIELLQRIKSESANLSLAWDWALESSEFDVIQRLIANVLSISILRGPLSYGEVLFEQAMAVTDGDSHPDLYSDLTFAFSKIYLLQMRFDEMIDLMKNLPETARSLFTIGQALNAKGECAPAREWLEKALTLSQSLDEPYLKMDCLRELGNSAYRLVDYPAAQDYYGQCLGMATELGDLRSQSAVLNNWASVNWDLGELDVAEKRYRKALEIYRDLGNRVGEAKALNNLSNVIADLGDLEQSLEYSYAALAIHKDMGNIRGQSAVLNNLAATYFTLKQYDAARDTYEKTMGLYELMDNRSAIAETLGNLSFLDCRQGRFAEGRQKALRAIKLAKETGDKVGLSNATYFLGRIEVAEGYLGQAEVAFNKAIEIRESAPHPGRLLELEVELMNIAFQRREFGEAKRLLMSALEKMDSLDSTNDPERIQALLDRIGPKL